MIQLEQTFSFTHLTLQRLSEPQEAALDIFRVTKG